LHSTPILMAAIDKMDAPRMKTFARVDDPVRFLKRELNVQVGKQDELIAVSFESPYPQEAAQVVNSVVDSYVQYQSKHTQKSSVQLMDIFRAEKKNLDVELKNKN